jgi:hypothetical protein
MSSIKDYAAVRRLAIIGKGIPKSEPEPGDGDSTLADIFYQTREQDHYNFLLSRPSDLLARNWQ